MATLEAVLKDIESLGISSQQIILDRLEELITLKSFSSEVTETVKENRFSKGKCCPYCQSDKVCRNGKYNNNQRYLCRGCKRTFTDLTFSPSYNSKKTIRQWREYAKCMVNGYTLKKCAELVGISVPTAFYWRHKMLDAVRKYVGVGSVDGIVEIDDTFFRESFKGHHTENSVFKMPRKSFHRGVKPLPGKKSKVKRKRGLSKDQISVMCAIDRSGNIIAEPIGRGMVQADAIQHLFGGRISNNSIACVDGARAFKSASETLNIELQRVKAKSTKEGIYHIQHVNSFHSQLKKWMVKFNGVATKYLNNYMIIKSIFFKN